MTSSIDKAIEIIVQSINSGTDPTDALKLTQAALNLAHTAQVQEQTRLTTT